MKRLNSQLFLCVCVCVGGGGGLRRIWQKKVAYIKVSHDFIFFKFVSGLFIFCNNLLNYVK